MNKQNIVHPDHQSGFDIGAYSDGVVFNDILIASGQASEDFNIPA